MQRTLKEIYEQIRELVQSSSVSPHCQKLPEYTPGPFFHTRMELRFSLNGGRAEKCAIHIQYSQDRSEEERTEQEGGTEYRIPVEKEEVTVRWSTLRDRTVQDSRTTLQFYQQVADLAGQIEYLLDEAYITNVFVENPEPEQPSQLDLLAAAAQTDAFPIYKKKRWVEIAEEHGLKKSGRKAEIRRRVKEYAEKEGLPEKVEKHENWRDNQYRCAG